jgi:hypothetical protein
VPAATRRPCDLSFSGDLLNCISHASRRTSPLADSTMSGMDPFSAMEEKDAFCLSREAVHLVLPSMLIC